MQKKLLYSSVLCALFGISGIVFGMEENNLADKYTFLALNINNNFVAFSRASLDQQKIYRNDEEFHNNWLINDDNWMQLQAPTIQLSLKPCRLVITDTDDKFNRLSVVITNTNINQVINLGSFKRSNIEHIKKCIMEPNKSDMLLFRAGTYHPITLIAHEDLNKNYYSAIEVKSTVMERQEAIQKENTISQNKKIQEQRESKIKITRWIRNIVLTGGSILALAWLFPDRFTQFWQLFKIA
jgi:hypothetical protein